MKKLLFLSLFFICYCFKAQNSEPYSFSEVVKVSDSTKSSKLLYAGAKMWFAQSFKDPKEVIILDDANNNILVGRGNMRYSSKIFSGSAAREGWITFDVQIACKDGRYKYSFSNFIHDGHTVDYGIITNDEFLPTMTGIFAGGAKSYKIKVTNEIRDLIKNRIEYLVSTLKETMDKPITTKEEW